MKYLFLFLLFLSTSLFANIGKITAIKGDASIIRGAKILIPKTGFIIEKNDNITTKANARLQVVFNDNTIISLGKNTTFSINDYFYDEQQPKKTKASFKVARGIFKTITGRIGKINPNKFKLKTKSASIGIRGTVFFGETSNGKDSISCTQGQIVVITSLGIVEVKAGEITKVESGKPPSTPTPLSNEEKGTLEKDSGAQENEQESGQTEGVANQQPQEENQEDSGDSAQNDEGQDEGTPNQPNEGEPTPPQTPPEPDTPPSFIPEPPSYDPNDLGPNNDPEITPPTPPLVTGGDNPNITGGGTTGDKSSKTATYYGMHSTNFANNSGLNIYAGMNGATSFYEIASSPIFSITNGILSGTSSLYKTQITDSGLINEPTPRTYTLSNIALTGYAIPSSYSGFVKIANISESISDDQLTGSVFADDRQEFFIWKAKFDKSIEIDANTFVGFEYRETMIFGERTLLDKIPTDGISRYAEPNGYNQNIGTMSWSHSMIHSGSVPYNMSINWKNKNLLSYELQGDRVFIIIGAIKDDGTYATVETKGFYESMSDYSQKQTLHTSNSGYLFGSNYQGIGVSIDVTDGANIIRQTHGEYRIPSMDSTTPTPTTTSTFTGFANRTVDLNTVNMENLSFSINRANGTISSGSIGNLFSFNGTNTAGTSAYITDDTFASLGFGDIANSNDSTDGWIMAIDTGTISADGISDDSISWGYWGAKTGNDVISPEIWVATTLTKVEDISGWAYDDNIATATYQGQAMGWQTNGQGVKTFINPAQSKINFTLDFANSNHNAALYINGSETAWKSFSSLDSIGSGNKFTITETLGSSNVEGHLYNNGQTSIGNFKFINGSESALGAYKARQVASTPN